MQDTPKEGGVSRRDFFKGSAASLSAVNGGKDAVAAARFPDEATKKLMEGFSTALRSCIMAAHDAGIGDPDFLNPDRYVGLCSSRNLDLIEKQAQAYQLLESKFPEANQLFERIKSAIGKEGIVYPKGGVFDKAIDGNSVLQPAQLEQVFTKDAFAAAIDTHKTIFPQFRRRVEQGVAASRTLAKALTRLLPENNFEAVVNGEMPQGKHAKDFLYLVHRNTINGDIGYIYARLCQCLPATADTNDWIVEHQDSMEKMVADTYHKMITQNAEIEKTGQARREKFRIQEQEKRRPKLAQQLSDFFEQPVHVDQGDLFVEIAAAPSAALYTALCDVMNMHDKQSAIPLREELFVPRLETMDGHFAWAPADIRAPMASYAMRLPEKMAEKLVKIINDQLLTGPELKRFSGNSKEIVAHYREQASALASAAGARIELAEKLERLQLLANGKWSRRVQQQKTRKAGGLNFDSR